MKIKEIKYYKILIIIIIAVLIIPSTIYVINDHNDKLIIVRDKKVIEAANDCKNEKKCTNQTVTLKELYDLKYLDNIYDPITRELINEESYVDFNSNEFKIVK